MITAVFDCGVVASVSNDRDLLVLGKPFGVPVVTPIQFLKLVRSRSAF